MKVLGIIPARGGSKGVKNKNIRECGGKPLITWSIESAVKSNLSEVILSTDSEDIANVGKTAGVSVPFIRPAELATDSAKAIPVLQHAVKYMEDQGHFFDAVMMLQPTSPLRSINQINTAIQYLNKDSEADSVISVVNVHEFHPARMKYLRDGVLIDPPFCEAYENQPRQELEPMFIRSGTIYLVRRDTLMNNNSLKGKKCLALEIQKGDSVNIDSEDDLKEANKILNHRAD